MVGVGAVIYNDNLANTNRLNDEDANLAARIKSLEDSTAVSALTKRVSTLESSSASSGTKADSNCAALKALDTALDAVTAGTGDGEINAAVQGAITGLAC